MGLPPFIATVSNFLHGPGWGRCIW